MSKRAIILAGGAGTRLRPYTVVLPKPLMPIGDYPILEIVVRQLALQGFGHITMAVSHQAELIQAFFGNGAKWKVTIDYSLEDKPLNTMGPLKLIHDLPDQFLIMNGDVLTDLDFVNFLEQHIRSGQPFTVSAHRREEKNEYGVLEVDAANQLVGFREKPVTQFIVSMGVYAASKSIVKFIPDGKPYGFDHLMHDMITAKQSVAVSVYDGLWLDIGRPDDYAEAVEVFEKNRNKFLKGS